MATLQQAGVLKAIFSSRCLSNYKELFNLFHLVCWCCSATHTLFLSYSEITVTLEDVANQLLLPILGDVNLSDIELSAEGEAMEAELRKGMNGNTKLSHWLRALSKASNAVRHAAFIFGSHPYYDMKHFYFRLAIKIFAGMNLPLAPMFLGHLYSASIMESRACMNTRGSIGTCGACSATNWQRTLSAR